MKDTCVGSNAILVNSQRLVFASETCVVVDGVVIVVVVVVVVVVVSADDVGV